MLMMELAAGIMTEFMGRRVGFLMVILDWDMFHRSVFRNVMDEFSFVIMIKFLVLFLGTMMTFGGFMSNDWLPMDNWLWFMDMDGLVMHHWSLVMFHWNFVIMLYLFLLVMMHWRPMNRSFMMVRLLLLVVMHWNFVMVRLLLLIMMRWNLVMN